MIKISIVGAPTTGKTVLSRRLANTLSLLDFKADNVIEYARTYLFRYIKPMKKRVQDPLDQVMIYIGQKRREEDLKFCDFVICDSATFIPFIFAGLSGYNLEDPREVMVVHKLFKWSIQEISSYDFIFYLPPDIEYKPKRAKWKVSTKDERKEIARRIENYLLDVKYPYYRIEATTIEEREDFIINVLKKNHPELNKRLKKSKSKRSN